MDMMMYTYDYYIRGATTTFSAVDRFVFHLFRSEKKNKKEMRDLPFLLPLGNAWLHIICCDTQQQAATFEDQSPQRTRLTVQGCVSGEEDLHAQGIICLVHFSSEIYGNGAELCKVQHIFKIVTYLF